LVRGGLFFGKSIRVHEGSAGENPSERKLSSRKGERRFIPPHLHRLKKGKENSSWLRLLYLWGYSTRLFGALEKRGERGKKRSQSRGLRERKGLVGRSKKGEWRSVTTKEGPMRKEAESPVSAHKRISFIPTKKGGDLLNFQK